MCISINNDGSIAPNRETCQAGLYGLRQIIQALPPTALAFSGGLDSRFLLHILTKMEKDVLAIHVTGLHMRKRESEDALRWLKERDQPHVLIPFDPLAIPGIAANGRDRCYHCKLAMFTAIKAASGGRLLMDGSNASDVREYRPGRQALQEMDVLSPLAEAGLNKPMIKVLAAEEGLDWPHQPNRPCLLTRFPYDTPPTLEVLDRVAAAEDAVEDLGFTDFRLRWDPAEPRLQVSGTEADLVEVKREALTKALAKHGFEHVLLEIKANVSGFYDYFSS